MKLLAVVAVLTKEVTAKLMFKLIIFDEASLAINNSYFECMANSKLWTKKQVKLAFHLYCQIPFGKIDSRDKEIVALAKAIGRTSSAVAMKRKT